MNETTQSSGSPKYIVGLLFVQTIALAALIGVLVQRNTSGPPPTTGGSSNAPNKDRGAPLARIADEAVYADELEFLLLRRADEMVAMQGAPEDAEMREIVISQLRSPDVKASLLEELVRRRMFARRARELKLDKSVEFRQRRRASDEMLLGMLLQRQSWREQAPSEKEVRAFFEANGDRYHEPAAIEALVFRVNDDEESRERLARIKSAADFLTERSRVGKLKGEEAIGHFFMTQGEATEPFSGDVSELFELDEGQWTKAALPAEGGSLLVLVKTKKEAWKPSIEEIRDRVRRDCESEHRRRVSDALAQQLKQRYSVSISEPKDAEQ